MWSRLCLVNYLIDFCNCLAQQTLCQSAHLLNYHLRTLTPYGTVILLILDRLFGEANTKLFCYFTVSSYTEGVNFTATWALVVTWEDVRPWENIWWNTTPDWIDLQHDSKLEVSQDNNEVSY